MKVLILAAGYGTRLYPIITDTPKPLLPVAGKPLINYLLEKFSKTDGINEFLVVSNNKFYKHFLAWAKKAPQKIAPIAVINDGTMTPDDRLGSVGDIDFVLKHHKVDDDLLVVGGDNLFDYSLTAYLAFARSKAPHVSVGLYDIKDLQAATSFGVVQIDAQGKVFDFEEKPAKPKSTLIAMCSYYFPRASLGFITDYLGEGNKPDKAGDYIRWLTIKKGVYGYKFEGQWYDIGSIKSYQEAQEKFKDH